MSGRACVFTPGQRVRLQSAIRYEAKNIEAIFVMAVGDDAMVYWPATSYQQSPEPFMTPLSNLVAPEPPKATDWQLLAYERLDSQKLQAAIVLRPGERLLVLRPFGWHIDGKHIPNAAEHFEREFVCREHDWIVVHEFGPYIAVVTTREAQSK